MKEQILPVGKLDSDILKEIVFDKITFKREEVKTRPGIGEDCAVVDFGAYDCVISTDPITASVKDIGRLSIHISCNDVASNGVEPLGILLAVMLPVGSTTSDVGCIMEQAARAAELCGVEIMGGHTEITPAVNQPVIVSTALGRAVADTSAKAEDMKNGDLIYMTKTAGLEGTGILACDFADDLSTVLTAEELAHAKAMLDCVSVVREGIIAGRIGTHGMHDITEGGVLGAVWEMCRICGKGAKLYESEIRVEEVTKKICAYYGMNPLRLISSGSMVIVVEPDKAAQLESEMREAGILCTCIGEVTDAGGKVLIGDEQGQTREISPPASDEIYKAVRR